MTSLAANQPENPPQPLTTPPALTEPQRQSAMDRLVILRSHLDDAVPIVRVAETKGIPERTLRRWLSAYRRDGLTGLARQPRADKGRRRLPDELVLLIEGLALRRPRPSIATVHRHSAEVAAQRGWPIPSYATVYDITHRLDPALSVLAHEGTARYRELFDLIHRRQAERPNQIWQADHTQLDLWVITPSGKPGRPWLTVIEDDYSRAIAGYAVNLSAPSALMTALAFRQAIWRKAEPDWHVCGIPEALHVDHGSDFTSAHLEQVMADLRTRPFFSLPGQPRGRGKVERLFRTVNQQCLAHLPGYAPRGTPDRAGRAQLSLAELEEAIGRFVREVYNLTPHSETGAPPQQRWGSGSFLPRLPGSLEQLDLLLLTVAKPRTIHPDGIHFQSLRYLDPLLAAYVGERVIIRYDPRDMAEIRVFHRERFLCRAICPDLADHTISLKDITAARNARRRDLRSQLRERASVVDRLIDVHRPSPSDLPLPEASAAPAPPVPARPRLKRYREE
ncbi:Mu transposase C-terminal domain-containing protein [Streptosporangium sp. NPDC002721]|uniref:Mu transposase C-terminal domain-containing protein n=1 Tax=Streptosporangium sp. NPDC002721 TaxID=3366188 RepID=UPI0036C5F91A